jgi:hypothetical protein
VTLEMTSRISGETFKLVVNCMRKTGVKRLTLHGAGILISIGASTRATRCKPYTSGFNMLPSDTTPQNNALERTRRVGVPASRAVVRVSPRRSTQCCAGVCGPG